MSTRLTTCPSTPVHPNQEYTGIDLSWQQRHLQMTPQFAATLASQPGQTQSEAGDVIFDVRVAQHRPVHSLDACNRQRSIADQDRFVEQRPVCTAILIMERVKKSKAPTTFRHSRESGNLGSGPIKGVARR